MVDQLKMPKKMEAIYMQINLCVWLVVAMSKRIQLRRVMISNASLNIGRLCKLHNNINSFQLHTTPKGNNSRMRLKTYIFAEPKGQTYDLKIPLMARSCSTWEKTTKKYRRALFSRRLK